MRNKYTTLGYKIFKTTSTLLVLNHTSRDMDFIKSLFTRKKPLSSNVRRNNTARNNYAFNELNAVENTNFSNVNPALRNLKIKRAANTVKSTVASLKQKYNSYAARPNLYNASLLSAATKLRNNTQRSLKMLEKMGKGSPENLVVLESLKFEELPLQNATGLATNNAMSVATNDPRKLSGASNISGGRRRRGGRKTRRGRRRN